MGTVGVNVVAQEVDADPWLATLGQRHMLDNNRALNNDPKIIREYFRVLKEVIDELKIKPQNIYNMDEKGFLLVLIQHSGRRRHSYDNWGNEKRLLSSKLLVHLDRRSYR